MLRALGLKRNHLMRAFAMEGAVYAVAAAVAGAFVGIGVGWVITVVTTGIVGADDPELTFRLAVEPASLVAGAAIGLIISLVTVWGTSARISSLNVIRAIRDLPEPSTTKTRLRSLVLGSTGVVIGGLLFGSGQGNDEAVPALVGPAMTAFCGIPLLRRLVPRRVAVVALSSFALAWGVLCFTVLPDAFESSGIEVFVAQGVVLVAAAVAISSSADHLWVALADRLSRSGRGLALRLGLAYPLDRKFRTGMLLGMYALVLFTITFLAVLSGIFGNQAPQITADARAGYDLFVDSNEANPLTAEQLAQQRDVTAVASLTQLFPDFTADFESEPTAWALTGFDAALLARGTPALIERDPRLASDREVFEAVLADPSMAIVPDFFLQGEGGPPEAGVEIGDEIILLDGATDDQRRLRVVGTTDDWLFNGVLVSDDAVVDLFGARAVANRHYVAVANGAEPTEVAATLTGQLVANGADAVSFVDEIEGELAEQQGFFRLMQGYLGLGLVIGIAGLGVVMVRAVRERRRQVGMLRAIGVSSAVIRRAFLFEATFIAAQGIVIGVGLGLVTAYQLLVNSDTFGDADLPFAVPWLTLVVVVLVPLAASLAATIAPAAQAARITPAAALRIAD